MTTAAVRPTSGEYVEVVSGTTNVFFIQNVSPKLKACCMVRWGSALPAPNDVGYVLEVGDSIVRGGLTGKVYARGMTSDVLLAVTEE
jgi:hypothetical protein